MRGGLAVLALMLVAGPAQAQELTLTLGDGVALETRTIQLLALLTLLSLVPGLAMMVTCFPFVLTVLSILRQAIGLQAAPPNMLIVTLALFLTWFIMDPVFMAAWHDAGAPFSAGLIPIEEAVPRAVGPFRIFMTARVDPETLQQLASLRPDMGEWPVTADGLREVDQVPLSLLVPSFLLSEIERAFQIGFLVFLPFLVIDLVVSAVLMSMGMMMVPPVMIALPFKLAFFVVADGWTLISTALVQGYG